MSYLGFALSQGIQRVLSLVHYKLQSIEETLSTSPLPPPPQPSLRFQHLPPLETRRKGFGTDWKHHNTKMKVIDAKMKRLKEMDLFVLDNSLSETTVVQLRRHTLENKWEIYEQVSAEVVIYLLLFIYQIFTNMNP